MTTIRAVEKLCGEFERLNEVESKLTARDALLRQALEALETVTPLLRPEEGRVYVHNLASDIRKALEGGK